MASPAPTVAEGAALLALLPAEAPEAAPEAAPDPEAFRDQAAVLAEISVDSPASALQRSAGQLRGHADQIQRAACDLLMLA